MSWALRLVMDGLRRVPLGAVLVFVEAVQSLRSARRAVAHGKAEPSQSAQAPSSAPRAGEPGAGSS